jgi:hypothetical protein
MLTSHALQPVSELTLEIVYNEAIIPHSVRGPFLGAGNVRRQPLELSLSFGGYHERGRLLKHTIQIFMQAIKQ